ncbi:hypothetical protein QQP08_008172 [Theobroma cacao]|nr:hypothetical protein QQP08_008172 [Theobroma cacao]
MGEKAPEQQFSLLPLQFLSAPHTPVLYCCPTWFHWLPTESKQSKRSHLLGKTLLASSVATVGSSPPCKHCNYFTIITPNQIAVDERERESCYLVNSWRDLCNGDDVSQLFAGKIADANSLCETKPLAIFHGCPYRIEIHGEEVFLLYWKFICPRFCAHGPMNKKEIKGQQVRHEHRRTIAW